jgi:hypothetical protein
MAKDIAFIEHYGPNPTTFQHAARHGAEGGGHREPKKTRALRGAAKLDALFDYAAGRIKPSANGLKAVADGIAHLNSAGKLGGAAIASFFGDKPMYEAVSHLNDIPMIQRWSTEVSDAQPGECRGPRRSSGRG